MATVLKPRWSQKENFCENKTHLPCGTDGVDVFGHEVKVTRQDVADLVAREGLGCNQQGPDQQNYLHFGFLKIKLKLIKKYY